MAKFKVTVIETVRVQRKVVYDIEAENEQEILNAKGKTTQHLDIIESEVVMADADMEIPIIMDIIKARVITNEEII